MLVNFARAFRTSAYLKTVVKVFMRRAKRTAKFQRSIGLQTLMLITHNSIYV